MAGGYSPADVRLGKARRSCGCSVGAGPSWPWSDREGRVATRWASSTSTSRPRSRSGCGRQHRRGPSCGSSGFRQLHGSPRSGAPRRLRRLARCSPGEWAPPPTPSKPGRPDAVLDYDTPPRRLASRGRVPAGRRSEKRIEGTGLAGAPDRLGRARRPKPRPPVDPGSRRGGARLRPDLEVQRRQGRAARRGDDRRYPSPSGSRASLPTCLPRPTLAPEEGGYSASTGPAARAGTSPTAPPRTRGGSRGTSARSRAGRPRRRGAATSRARARIFEASIA